MCPGAAAPHLAVARSLGLLHPLTTVPEEGWPHLPCCTPYSLAEGIPGPMGDVHTGTCQLATLVQQPLPVTGTAAPRRCLLRRTLGWAGH